MERKTPTIGNLFGLLDSNTTRLDHSKIVETALDAFTKAEKGVQTAIEQIDADIEKQQQEIRDAEQRIEQAGESRNRLTRVLDRVKAFTA